MRLEVGRDAPQLPTLPPAPHYPAPLGALLGKGPPLSTTGEGVQLPPRASAPPS